MPPEKKSGTTLDRALVAVKDHVHPPTVSSSSDLAAFLRVFFGIFGLYARGLLGLR